MQLTTSLPIDSYAIIIASRLRTEKLVALLASIRKLTLLPAEVIIVESGSNSTKESKEILSPQIKYKHILFSGLGQIRQKQIGIESLSKNAEWVLFLDDDVILENVSLERLFSVHKKYSQYNLVVGLGLADKNHRPSTFFEILPKRFFGKVLRNGINVSYMKSKNVLKTNWLNGISMWHKSVISIYLQENVNVRYAICEDLIFSYKVARLGTLLFVPDAIYFNQELHETNTPDFNTYTLMKLYFVIQNKEFSKTYFLITQLASAIIQYIKSLNFSNFIKSLIILKSSAIIAFGNEPLKTLQNRIEQLANED